MTVALFKPPDDGEGRYTGDGEDRFETDGAGTRVDEPGADVDDVDDVVGGADAGGPDAGGPDAGGTDTGGPDAGVAQQTEESPVISPEHATTLILDPVSRVSGSGELAFDVEINPDARQVLDAYSQATLFRGYEEILRGRDPRDAVDISSRVCGFGGVVHSITSSMALEMAFPVEPPPLGVWTRNMGQGAGFLLSLAGNLFLLAGPDYSEQVLSETNPEIVERAYDTSALRTEIHGYETIGDIMAALNPLEGELYLEVIEKARRVEELTSLVVGKLPHPSTAAPGGITTTVERTTYTQFYSRLKDLADYAKKVPPIWDDLLDFLLENWEGYERVGARPIHLISMGVWDDPDVYDGRYQSADRWGKARLSTPGIVVDGELETVNLTEIDEGIEEFVEHTFYDDWTVGEGGEVASTPSGGSVSPNHPWNKDTIPNPGQRSLGDRYTWTTAPRWERTPLEGGAFSRLWITARAQEFDNPHIQPTGDGVDFTVPEVARPEMTFRWDVPEQLNAAERMRGRAYGVLHAGLACLVGLLQSLDTLKQGKPDVHTPFTVPKRGTHRGVGFWEAARGPNTHHVTIEDSSMETYQILAPSTWTTSPEDPFGTNGPIEQAVLNTPLLEEFESPEDIVGVDILRAIRSFDPCMACSTH